MNYIISVSEAKTLGRPIGKVADDKIVAFITEVEQTIVRPRLGDNLFMRLMIEERSEDLDLLLSGGQYVTRCGETRVFTGLKTAVAYYTYAQNVRAGDFESTRYGMMLKDGDYSQHISAKERDSAANSATAVADAYLQECIIYCKEKGLISPSEKKAHNLHVTTGCIIHKIG